MRNSYQRLLGLALALALALLSGCSLADNEADAGVNSPAAEAGVAQAAQSSAVPTLDPTAAPTAESTAAPTAESTAAPTGQADVIAGLEQTFTQIYRQVRPSVVTIQVTITSSQTTPEFPGLPFGDATPQPQPSGGLGSGFVWDDQGHIITNNHVIANADSISVIFSDGSITSGQVVGADPQSDLAVVKVDPTAHDLRPIEVADSTQVEVGELAIAIGNPFGEQSTMTTGIISALGRQLPAGETSSGPTYTIPDIIQTDAAINPGNSGGPLLNEQGQVIGVTSAILSPSGTNAGLGYAIPSAIVKQVVPALISTGSYAHPWLGISGTSLVPDLAQAMGLPANQRGALVGDVTAGSPADEAGLKPSTQTTTIEGIEVQVGGDVITAIEGQPVQSFDDLVAYLYRNTKVGDTVQLTVLRNGEEQQVDVTLAARPSTADQAAGGAGGVTLGIQALTLTPQIAQAMGLDAGQSGVLVGQIASGSPADQAGLRGSDTTATINGQQIQVGGDVITAVDGTAVASVEELRTQLQQAGSDSSVPLTIIRDGEQIELTVDLSSSGAGR